MMNEDKGFKKYKLIYSIELIVIAIVFLVLGILKLTGLMKSHEVRTYIFIGITLAGGTWVIIDFFWTLLSKKRRKKQCLLDKILNLPIPLYIIPLDIYFLIAHPDLDTFSIFVGAAFLYVFINYTFQAIYHYFKPLPSLLIAYEEEKRMKEEELKASQESAIEVKEEKSEEEETK